MTKRIKLLLAILLGAIAIACCVAGCKVGQADREELLKDYKGGMVTYYANGGCFNKNTAIVVRELHFKQSDVPFFDITEDTGSVDVMYSGYDFVGWYLPARYESGEHEGEIMYTYTYKVGDEDKTVPAYPKLNEDGTPVTDRTEARPLFYIEGSEEDILERHIEIVPSDTPVTSDYIIGAEDKLIVCANWKPALKFVFKLVTESGEFQADGKTYKNGDVIATAPFGKGMTANPGETSRVSFNGMTFVANYKGEDCAEYVTDYNREDYEGQTEIVVWSRFIEGSWTIVKNNPNKVREMFNGLSRATARYFLLEDVDCSTIADFGISRGVRAEIKGDGEGKKLYNLNFKPATFSAGNGDTVAPVFGGIYSTAKISNVTLSNISISLKGRGNLSFYAICSDIEEGATFENFTIDGVTAEVDIPNNYIVTNAQNGDRSNWLFGGKGTDAQFLAAYSGITLMGNNVLTIK